MRNCGRLTPRKTDSHGGSALLAGGPPQSVRFGLGGGDADEAAAAPTVLELDVTSDQREKRVVLALPHIFSGLMLGAALANQDRAGVDELSAEALYAQPLPVGIAAVC